MQRALFRGIFGSLLCRGALRFLLRLGGSWRTTNATWLWKLGRVGFVLFASWLLLLFSGEVLAACTEFVIRTLALFSAQVQADDDDEAERVSRWRALTRRLAKTVRVPASLGSLTRFQIGFGTRIAFCWGVASSRPWAEADEQVFRTTSVDHSALVGGGTKTGALAASLAPDWIPQLRCVHERDSKSTPHGSRRPCLGIGLLIPFLEVTFGTKAAEANEQPYGTHGNGTAISLQAERLYIPLTAIIALLARNLCRVLLERVEVVFSQPLVRFRRRAMPNPVRTLLQQLLHLFIPLLNSFMTGVRAAQVASVTISSSSHEQGILIIQRAECELDQRQSTIHLHGQYGLCVKPKRSSDANSDEGLARAFLRALRGTESAQQYAGMGVFGCIHLRRSLDDRVTRCDQNASIVAWRDAWQQDCGLAVLGHTHGIYRSRPTSREAVDVTPEPAEALDSSASTPPLSARRNADLQFEMGGVGLELSFEHILALLQEYGSRWLRRQKQHSETRRVGRARSNSGTTLLRKLSRLSVSLRLTNIKLDFIGGQDEVRLDASELELFLDRSRAAPVESTGSNFSAEAQYIAKSLHIRLEQCKAALLHRHVSIEHHGGASPEPLALRATLSCGGVYGSLQEVTLQKLGLRVDTHQLLEMAQIDFVRDQRQVRLLSPRLDWCPDVHEMLLDLRSRWQELLPLLDEHFGSSRATGSKSNEAAGTHTNNSWHLCVQGEAHAWGRFPQGNNSGVIFSDLQLPLRRPWCPCVERLSWFVDDRAMGHATKVSFWIHWTKERRLIEAHTSFMRFQMPHGFRFVQRYNLFLAHLRLYFRYRKERRQLASLVSEQEPVASTGAMSVCTEAPRKSIFPNLDIRADRAEFVLCDQELERWYNQHWLVMLDERMERTLRERLAQSSVGPRRKHNEHLADELARQHAQLYVQRMQKWQQQMQQQEQPHTRNDPLTSWIPDTVDQQLFVAKATNVRFRLIRSDLDRAQEDIEAAAFAVQMDAALGAAPESTTTSDEAEEVSVTRPPTTSNATGSLKASPMPTMSSATGTATNTKTTLVQEDGASTQPDHVAAFRQRLLDPEQWYALGRRRLVVDIEGALTIHIRHFPFPVLYLSQGLHLQGTVALGELLVSQPYAAERDLQLGQHVWVRYRRAISPNRWYCDWKMNCLGPLRLTWSRALAASLKDVIDGFQGFGGAGKDPSPLLNWWNQLRLILHGRWQLACPDGLLLTFLSSIPYDPDHDERLEWHLLGSRTAITVDRRSGLIQLEADAWQLRLRVANAPGDDAPNKLSGAEPLRISLRVEATPAGGPLVTHYVHPLGSLATRAGTLPPAVRSSQIRLASPKDHQQQQQQQQQQQVGSDGVSAADSMTARAVPYAAWHTSLATDPQHDTYRAFRAQSFSFRMQCHLSWDGADTNPSVQLSTYALAMLLFRALELAGANRLLGQSPYAFRPVSRKPGIVRSGRRRYGVRFGELIQAFELVLTLPKSWSICFRDALRPTEWFTLRAGAVDASLSWRRAPASAFESIPGRRFEQHIRVSAPSLRIDLSQGLFLQTAAIRYEQALEVERMQGLLTPSALETLRLWPDAFTAVFLTAKRVSQRALFDIQDPLRQLYREIWSHKSRSAVERNSTTALSRTPGTEPLHPLSHGSSSGAGGRNTSAAKTSVQSAGSSTNSGTMNAATSAQRQQHELGNRARRIANALGMPLSMQRKPEADALDLRDLLLQEHLDQVKQQKQRSSSSSVASALSPTPRWSPLDPNQHVLEPAAQSDVNVRARRTKSLEQGQAGVFQTRSLITDADASSFAKPVTETNRPRATSWLDPRPGLPEDKPYSAWSSRSSSGTAWPSSEVAMPRVPETADVGLADAGSGRTRYTQRRQLLSQRVRFQLTLVEPSVWIRTSHGRDAVLLSANKGILDVVECVCHRGASDLGAEMDYRVCLMGANIIVEGQHLSLPEESAPIYLYYVHPVPAEDLRARHIEVAVPALYLAATAAEFHTLFRIVREVLLSKSSQALRVSSILKPLRQDAVVFDDADFVIERALTLRTLLHDVDLLLLHGGVDSLASLWSQLDTGTDVRLPGSRSTDGPLATADRRPASGGLSRSTRPAARVAAPSATVARPRDETDVSTALDSFRQRREQAYAFRWWLAAQARAWQVLLVDALRGRIHHDDRSINLADELEDLDIILEIARVRWCLLLSRRRAFLELSIRRIYGLQRRYMSGRELNDYGITDLVVRNRSRDLDLDDVIRGDSFRYVSVSEGTIGGVMRYSRLTLDMAKTIHIRLYGVLVDRLYEYFFGDATGSSTATSGQHVAVTGQHRTTASMPIEMNEAPVSLEHEQHADAARMTRRERLDEPLPSERSYNVRSGDDHDENWSMTDTGALRRPPTLADQPGTAGVAVNEPQHRLPGQVEVAERKLPAGESRSSLRYMRPTTSSKASITPVQIDYAYLSSLEIIGSYHSGTGKEHSFLDFDDLCVLVPSMMYQAVTGSWQDFIEMVRRDFASAFVRDAIGQLSKRKFLGFLRRPVLAPASAETSRPSTERTGPVALIASPAATDAAIRRRRQRGRTPIVQAVERASAAAAVRSTAREHLSELVLFGSLRLVRRALMRDTSSATPEVHPETGEEEPPA